MSEAYRIIYSPAALDDLDSIYLYIAYQLGAGQTAKSQVERIREEIHSLDVFPKRYTTVDWEPWASAGMHKVSVNNYVIYYLVDDESMLVTIFRIFYGGRDVESIVNYNESGQTIADI